MVAVVDPNRHFDSTKVASCLDTAMCACILTRSNTSSSPTPMNYRFSNSPFLYKVTAPRYTRFMAQSVGDNVSKKLIKVDISSDTVCPWCMIGKKNLDKAMASAKDQFDFEVRWHPYFLNPSAPKEGIAKKDYYIKKFGAQHERKEAQMIEVFRSHGLEYDVSGLTGNTLDSHRLIAFAGHQGLDKQHALVEELFVGYFTQGKYIGDRQYLIEAAKNVGVQGAAEFLEDPNKGVQEVYEELEKYSSNNTGVPFYVINGKHQISGGQPPEVFFRAFQEAAKESK